MALGCRVAQSLPELANAGHRGIREVSYISTIITLLPGDLIATGTPGGTGDGRDPQVYLKAGQVVRTRVDLVGTLVNRCVPELNVDQLRLACD